MLKNLPNSCSDVTVKDVTATLGIISVQVVIINPLFKSSPLQYVRPIFYSMQGPNSKETLQKITSGPLDFSWSTMRSIKIGATGKAIFICIN